MSKKRVIDEVDKQIIEMLQQDGRRPFTQIARDLGLSEAGVRQRVQNLIEEKVMQIVAVTDPLTLGFQLFAMIGIRADGGRLIEIA
jgi:Lrp/AsnC family transcriptional regulator for asnA, asnC and gidA